MTRYNFSFIFKKKLSINSAFFKILTDCSGTDTLMPIRNHLPRPATGIGMSHWKAGSPSYSHDLVSTIFIFVFHSLCAFLLVLAPSGRFSKASQVYLFSALTESQNHRMVRVGRDLCGSSSPTLLPKQGHLQ